LIMFGRASMKPTVPTMPRPVSRARRSTSSTSSAAAAYRVPAVGHRRPSRVILPAPDRHAIPARRGDGGHHADGHPRAVERHRLLDVELQVPEHAARRPARGVESRPTRRRPSRPRRPGSVPAGRAAARRWRRRASRSSPGCRWSRARSPRAPRR
jgi:hypothetical protein